MKYYCIKLSEGSVFVGVTFTGRRDENGSTAGEVQAAQGSTRFAPHQQQQQQQQVALHAGGELGIKFIIFIMFIECIRPYELPLPGRSATVHRRPLLR